MNGKSFLYSHTLELGFIFMFFLPCRDFQTCTLLVEAIGLSEESMFPPRSWTLSWLHEHCQNRFGVTPKPYDLVQRWQFDQLVQNNVTKILFTNGLKDGWSVGGIKESLSDDLPVINFPNGAHHSDLSGRGPSEDDSDDIKQGFQDIIDIISKWMTDVQHKKLPLPNQVL